MSRQILNGWKEISSHIERGVRTAQRWEALLGMPVHRPALKDRAAVVAFSDELEAWLSRTSPAVREAHVAINGKEQGNESLQRVLDNMTSLVSKTSQLALQMRVLEQQLRRSRKIHHHRIKSRALARSASATSRSMGSVLTLRPRKRVLLPDSIVREGDLRR
jgi:hypothetical protein